MDMDTINSSSGSRNNAPSSGDASLEVSGRRTRRTISERRQQHEDLNSDLNEETIFDTINATIVERESINIRFRRLASRILNELPESPFNFDAPNFSSVGNSRRALDGYQEGSEFLRAPTPTPIYQNQTRTTFPHASFGSALTSQQQKRQVDTTTLPPKLRFGNRSFQPLAKFDHPVKAFPAKPDIPGFSTCHDKAAAARYIMSTIENENSDDDDYTFAPALDLFNRFWMETNYTTNNNTIESLPPRSSNDLSLHSQTTNTVLRALSESGMSLLSTFVRPTTDYQQWDAETSTINNPFNYDLWNDIPETGEVFRRRRLRVRSTRITSTSIGVGTSNNDDDGDELSRGTSPEPTYRPNNDSNNVDIHASGDFSTTLNETTFRGELFDEAVVSSMFRMDFPVIPNRRQSYDFPRSFFERGLNYRDGEIFSDVSSGSENDDNKNKDDDGDTAVDEDSEGESVFKLIPDADDTPSALVNGILNSSSINSVDTDDNEHGKRENDFIFSLPFENDFDGVQSAPPGINFDDFLDLDVSRMEL